MSRRPLAREALSLEAFSREALSPQAIASRFSREDLVGQFVLSRTKSTLPWPAFCLNGWHLSVESKLQVATVRSRGEDIGWLLGNAFGQDGRMVSGQLDVSPDSLEQTIYSHGGRFCVIVPIPGRIYLDPSGLLSAVYCPHQQVVASSPSLIPYDESTLDRTGVMTPRDLPYGFAMYPAGMTTRVGIDRVIPNHYLDLSTFETVRHWPMPGNQRVNNPDDAISEIGDVIRQQFRGIVKNGPGTLRLTAGNDTRMVLACARSLTDEFDAATADLNDDDSRADCLVAKRVARTAGLRHRILEWIDPDKRALELWLYRTGACTAARRGWMGTATYDQLDPRRAGIVGTVGGINRQAYWKPADSPTTVVSVDRLLAICRCADTPETRRYVEAWRSGVPANSDALRILDLYHIEQRMGSWAGVWSYGETRSLYHAVPMNHRRAIDLMMALPIELRRSGMLPSEVIRREWPELLKHPINQQPLSVRTRAVVSVAIVSTRHPRTAYLKLIRKRARKGTAPKNTS
jgi:hypothetical protein